MLGGSLCGRNWTRTEGAGEMRLLPGSRHPPPHGREPSAVTIFGLHSPRRLLGHCPQAQVPEAGVFPFCSSVGHWPEGRLRGIWKETLCSLHPDSSQQDRVGHVLPTLAGLRGLPAGRSSGGGWTPGVACFQVSGFRLSSHSFHVAPVGQFEAHAQAGSLHAHSKSGACGMCSIPDKPCVDLWSHSVAGPPAVFKHFYICGSS